jgi:hypothetical protein
MGSSSKKVSGRSKSVGGNSKALKKFSTTFIFLNFSSGFTFHRQPAKLGNAVIACLVGKDAKSEQTVAQTQKLNPAYADE